MPSRVVSTGTPFLFVGVDAAATVDALSPDTTALTRALDEIDQDLAGVYVWADDRGGETHTIYGRCFAPRAGLPEDPVTGSASGALGAHLFDLGILRSASDGTVSMRTTQGRAMGRPGNANVTLLVSDGKVASVSVAGHGTIVGEGTLRI
jgi:PhzF family phenazine biosynthesis protein